VVATCIISASIMLLMVPSWWEELEPIVARHKVFNP
jgi:hypothetical protein